MAPRVMIKLHGQRSGNMSEYKKLKQVTEIRLVEVERLKKDGLTNKQICNLLWIDEKLLKYIIEEINRNNRLKRGILK